MIRKPILIVQLWSPKRQALRNFLRQLGIINHQQILGIVRFAAGF